MPVLLRTKQLPYDPSKPYQKEQWFATREDAVRALRLFALCTDRKDVWRAHFEHLRGNDRVELRTFHSSIMEISEDDFQLAVSEWETHYLQSDES